VLGITGVGGAGKSSLTDELVRRLARDLPRAQRRRALGRPDPTPHGGRPARRSHPHERGSQPAGVHALARHAAARTRRLGERARRAARPRAAGYDLVILETAGIGQSGSEVVDLADVSLYVMTPEFGAPSQLEKIDMLDFADVVAINKADKRGAIDARAMSQKQVQRNRGPLPSRSMGDMPVFACMASRFGDAGVDALFAHLLTRLDERDTRAGASWAAAAPPDRAPELQVVVPPQRVRYLSEIAETVRGYHTERGEQACKAARADGLRRALIELGDTPPTGSAEPLARPARASPRRSRPCVPATTRCSPR
jgi:methylmalonyl-CoA mutase